MHVAPPLHVQCRKPRTRLLECLRSHLKSRVEPEDDLEPHLLNPQLQGVSFVCFFV